MVELDFDDVISFYDNGYFTLYGVYAYCDTDLDFYNFLSDHCDYSEDEIRDTMEEVTGAEDAYYNALAKM